MIALKHAERKYKHNLQSRPGFLTPWLVLTGISMVFQVLNVVAKFVGLEWGAAFSALVALVVEAYLFVCVHSFKYETLCVILS